MAKSKTSDLPDGTDYLSLRQAFLSLRQSFLSLKIAFDRVVASLRSLSKELRALRKENAELRKKLSLSPFSAATPSGAKPPFIKPDSAGKKKRPGRKVGHQGTSRAKPGAEKISSVVSHTLQNCPDCGHSTVAPFATRSRIIIDIELPTEPAIHQHIISQYWCPACKHTVEPAVTEALPGFSIGLKALVFSAFWHYDKGLSISKVLHLLKSVGLQLSPAALVGAWKALAISLKPEYLALIKKIRECLEALHADETGHREHGKRKWLWLFCTKTTAVFAIRTSRGSDVVLEILGAKIGAVLVTDFWKPYLAVVARYRQWCMAHFLREFKKIEFMRKELPSEYWRFRKVCKRLIQDAIRFSKTGKIPQTVRKKAYARYLRRLDVICAMCWRDPDVVRLVKRMRKYREGFFTYVLKKGVDTTNNHAERTLRFAVINRKTQFHTMSNSGSETMAVLMSIFKTFEMQGLDPCAEVMALYKKMYGNNSQQIRLAS